jgi:hypothetical protein
VAWLRRWSGELAVAAALRHGAGVGVGEERRGRGYGDDCRGGGVAARREACGCGESAKTAALEIGEYGRRRMKKKTERDPIVRLKGVRSAFRVMTGRGGRMTGRGGGSVRSHSSKLLE